MPDKIQYLENLLNELNELNERLKNLPAEDQLDFNQKLVELSKEYPDLTGLIYFIIFLEDKNSTRDQNLLQIIAENFEANTNYKKKLNEILNDLYMTIKNIEDERKRKFKIKEFLKYLKPSDIKIILIEFITLVIIILAFFHPENLDKLMHFIDLLLKKL